MVKQYRLVGFDNKKEALAELTSDLEGGEIGSGKSTLAIIQFEPTDQNLLTQNSTESEDIGLLSIKYSPPKDTSSLQVSCRIPQNYKPLNKTDAEIQFATAVAMFGMKLRESVFIKDADWPLITNVAVSSVDTNNHLQMEFLKILEKAKKIYGYKASKKKKN
jgi:Ca-activated chloride channel family protein